MKIYICKTNISLRSKSKTIYIPCNTQYIFNVFIFINHQFDRRLNKLYKLYVCINCRHLFTYYSLKSIFLITYINVFTKSVKLQMTPYYLVIVYFNYRIQTSEYNFAIAVGEVICTEIERSLTLVLHKIK